MVVGFPWLEAKAGVQAKSDGQVHSSSLTSGRAERDQERSRLSSSTAAPALRSGASPVLWTSSWAGPSRLILQSLAVHGNTCRYSSLRAPWPFKSFRGSTEDDAWSLLPHSASILSHVFPHGDSAHTCWLTAADFLLPDLSPEQPVRPSVSCQVSEVRAVSHKLWGCVTSSPFGLDAPLTRLAVRRVKLHL